MDTCKFAKLQEKQNNEFYTRWFHNKSNKFSQRAYLPPGLRTGTNGQSFYWPETKNSKTIPNSTYYTDINVRALGVLLLKAC